MEKEKKKLDIKLGRKNRRKKKFKEMKKERGTRACRGFDMGRVRKIYPPLRGG